MDQSLIHVEYKGFLFYRDLNMGDYIPLVLEDRVNLIFDLVFPLHQLVLYGSLWFGELKGFSKNELYASLIHFHLIKKLAESIEIEWHQ